jgi:hypothetical protein
MLYYCRILNHDDNVIKITCRFSGSPDDSYTGIQSPCRGLYQGSTELEAGMLPTRLRRSVTDKIENIYRENAQIVTSTG